MGLWEADERPRDELEMPGMILRVPGSHARDRAEGPPPLRVRTRNDYSVPFLVDCGQRDAIFVRRRWTPLHRLLYWADAFALLPEPDYDMVHAINAVPVLDRRPYVLSFEDYLPRVPEDRYVGWLERRLQRELLSERCVALIAISQYAVRQFRRQSRDFTGREVLEAKMEQLYPGVLSRRQEPKTLSSKLRLLFVGSDFMRKGGPALLRAHERLLAEGIPVETTVVSSLRWEPDDYIGPPSSEYVARETARLRGPGVVHHLGLANREVLREMDEAHLFVLPTLHDTFGYVSLEALAGATPVLASDTCAQPEIVEDGTCGFLLGLENDSEVGKWVWTYRNREPGYLEAYEAAVESLAQSIAERAMSCWAQPDLYRELSAGAVERVRTRFDREALRQRLEVLYERCRSRLPRGLSLSRPRRGSG